MLLGQISWIDIVVFVAALIPQLLLHVPISELLYVAGITLPYVLLRLPYEFIQEHGFTPADRRSPFTQQASLFEDYVIRCVRFAFARIPARVGRVFFSKPVALPFMRFRLLRHGYWRSPLHWQEVSEGGARGLWIIADPEREPDVVIYYAHGGGFSMGSSYFYLEFLMTLASLLRAHTSRSFTNPAVLALEYSLVPEASHPRQLEETVAGYRYALARVRDNEAKLCISGDSAGATLMLNLLLHIAAQGSHGKRTESEVVATTAAESPCTGLTALPVPAMALLISPWCTLISPLDQNTVSDFLDVANLGQYAAQFCGRKPDSTKNRTKNKNDDDEDEPSEPETYALDDPRVSPGNCTDLDLWRRAAPAEGILVLCGREEVFAPQIRAMEETWARAGVRADVHEEPGGIHAWPVACLFLSSSTPERTKGLHRMVDAICERMGKAGKLA